MILKTPQNHQSHLLKKTLKVHLIPFCKSLAKICQIFIEKPLARSIKSKFSIDFVEKLKINLQSAKKTYVEYLFILHEIL